MTETRFRLLMGFFLCAAIGMLTLSEISLAQPMNAATKPGCMGLEGDFIESQPPFSGAPHGRPPLPPAPGKQGVPALPPELQQLDLSEAQQDKIFALGHEQMPLLREQLKVADKAQDALHQLTLVQPFDVAKAQSAAQTQADAMAKVTVMHAEMEASVRSLLTPEQLQQLGHTRPRPPQP